MELFVHSTFRMHPKYISDNSLMFEGSIIIPLSSKSIIISIKREKGEGSVKNTCTYKSGLRVELGKIGRRICSTLEGLWWSLRNLYRRRYSKKWIVTAKPVFIGSWKLSLRVINNLLLGVLAKKEYRCVASIGL